MPGAGFFVGFRQIKAVFGQGAKKRGEKIATDKSHKPFIFNAERVGFEPTASITLRPISNRVP